MHLKLITLLIPLFFLLPCSAVSSDDVKVAAIYAKTGNASMINVFSFRGVNLAKEMINNRGGLLGHPLSIIELDNHSSPIGAKKAALKAVNLGVIGVIGGSWSSHSLAMAPVLQNNKIPMISSKSTNPKVTLKGNYIFRACFTDPFQGKVMALFAIRDLQAKTAVTLTNINSDYSMGLTNFFKRSFSESGGKIVWEGTYNEKAQDFKFILNKIKELHPDVVFLPGYQKDSTLIFMQAEKLGINSVFLGGDAWDGTMIHLAGKAAEGKYFTNHWHTEASHPASQKARQLYKDKYGEEINATGLLAYDALMLLADAVNSAGSFDRELIQNALAKTKNFNGGTGTISFDENGDPDNKDAVILQFQNGSVRFVKTFRP